MRQTSKTRRTIGIRGQLMGFLCFICFLLVGLFWFLSTQLLEPLYTTHIQKQLTEQAEAIVARMDEAIERGETLSYWAFGSQLYVNNTFFNSLRDDIFETGEMSSFCIDISNQQFILGDMFIACQFGFISFQCRIWSRQRID